MSINDIYEKAVDYYENQLKTNASKEVLDFIQDNQWPDSLLQKFRLGYAGSENNSFYQYMKEIGFEDDCLIDSDLVLRGGGGDYTDTFQEALIFPIIGDENVIHSIGARFMGFHEPRYFTISNKSVPKDKRFMIFGLNASAVSEQKNCIICEGYMDVIAMHSIGLTQAIALLPDGSLETLIAEITKYTQNVFLAFDNDAFGKKNAETARQVMERSGIYVWEIDLKQYRDPYECIRINKNEYATRDNGMISTNKRKFK